VDDSEIREALGESVSTIVSAIRMARSTAAELSAESRLRHCACRRRVRIALTIVETDSPNGLADLAVVTVIVLGLPR